MNENIEQMILERIRKYSDTTEKAELYTTGALNHLGDLLESGRMVSAQALDITCQNHEQYFKHMLEAYSLGREIVAFSELAEDEELGELIEPIRRDVANIERVLQSEFDGILNVLRGILRRDMESE